MVRIVTKSGHTVDLKRWILILEATTISMMCQLMDIYLLAYAEFLVHGVRKESEFIRQVFDVIQVLEHFQLVPDFRELLQVDLQVVALHYFLKFRNNFVDSKIDVELKTTTIFLLGRPLLEYGVST